MASRISGITIEIGGDTTKLSDALKGVNSDLKETSAKLKDVEKSLKFDPGNVELLEQKQKYLAQAIDDTKQKLETEKEALEQLNQKAVGGEDVADQQEALQREIVNTQASLQDLEGEADKMGDSLEENFGQGEESAKTLGDSVKEAGDSLKETGEKISGVGDSVSGVGSAINDSVSQPIIDLANNAVDAWHEVDDAMDTVTTKTGASGQALSDMQDIAKGIATEIPVDFQAAGDAVGEVNTRFGSTGDELKDLSTRFSEFASLNSVDVTTAVDSTQAAMAALGVKTSDTGNFLDTLNAAGQATGVSVTKLADDITKNGAALNEMGLSASDTAMFLANLDKNGTDSGTVMTALKTAYKNASKEGKSMKDVLADFSKTMSSSKSETDKTQAAIAVFGAKAGPAIEQFCADGKLSFSGLGTSMSDYAGNVESTYQETLDPLDGMTTTMNKLKEVGAELVDTAGPMITDALGIAAGAVQKLKDAWDSLSPGAQEAVVKAALIAAAIGPIVTKIGGLITGIGSIVSAGGSLMSFLGGVSGAAGAAGAGITLFSGPLLPIVGIIGGVVGAGVLLYKNWDQIKAGAQTLGEGISGAWDSIKTWTSGAWDTVKTTVSGAWDSIKSGTSTAAGAVGTTVSGAWDTIKSGASTAWQTVTGTISGAWTTITTDTGTKLEGVKTTISTAWDTVSANASTVWGTITTNVSTTWGTISATASTTWDTIKTTIGTAIGTAKTSVDTDVQGMQTVVDAFKSDGIVGAFEAIRKGASDKLDALKSHVETAIGKIEGLFSGAKLELPKIKLPHFKISGEFSLKNRTVPSLAVDWYKKAYDNAMIFTQPTVLQTPTGYKGFGDGGGGELVVGMNNLMSTIREAVGQQDQGDIIIPVYLGGERIDEIVVKASQRTNYRSGGR